MMIKNESKQVAALYRSTLPSLIEKTMEFGRETVQAVVWLVGLSSTLLVFIATNPAFLSGLSHGPRVLLCLGLVATIFCGVIQRVVYGEAEQKQYHLMTSLSGYFDGLLSDDENADLLTEEENHIQKQYLAHVLADHFNYPPEKMLDVIEGRGDEKAYNIRKRSKIVSRLQAASTNLFRGTCIAFLASVGFLADAAITKILK